MPQRYQRPDPPEFRREAVSLVKASGRSIKQVAGELGGSTESLRIWARQDQLDPRRARRRANERSARRVAPAASAGA
jgi:transposase-like protein